MIGEGRPSAYSPWFSESLRLSLTPDESFVSVITGLVESHFSFKMLFDLLQKIGTENPSEVEDTILFNALKKMRPEHIDFLKSLQGMSAGERKQACSDKFDDLKQV